MIHSTNKPGRPLFFKTALLRTSTRRWTIFELTTLAIFASTARDEDHFMPVIFVATFNGSYGRFA